MIPTLRSEFRKLFSVRSTYIISLLALALISFFGFYVGGFKNVVTVLPHNEVLAKSIDHVAPIISVFCALVGLLLITHEFRYNTIVYTFTSSRSRSKVLIAKIIVIASYVLVISTVLSIVALILYRLGASASAHSLSHQDINYFTYVGKVVFYSECFGFSGMVFGALIRNQVGALATLLILPNTLEGLLSLLFKQNSVYMPFVALMQVIQEPTEKGRLFVSDLGHLSPLHGAEVFLCYLVGAWIIAWVLWLRRDAA